MGDTLRGWLYQVQAGSLWVGLPFCAAVVLVDGSSTYLVAFGSVALALEAYALPHEIHVGVHRLSLSAEDEKPYGLSDGLYQIEAIVRS